MKRSKHFGKIAEYTFGRALAAGSSGDRVWGAVALSLIDASLGSNFTYVAHEAYLKALRKKERDPWSKVADAVRRSFESTMREK